MDRFDIYFASLVAMTLHPGSGKNGHRKLSLEECAELAQQMIALREHLTLQLDLD